MKTIRNVTFLFLAVVASATALLAKPIPGPKGGKIVTTEAPHVELFVAPDRTVVVSFYDHDLKLVAPAAQIVSAVAEAKGGKVNLTFAAKEGTLVSSSPLPEGDGYRVVLQVKDNAQARPKNYRIELHDEVCGECKRAEYACICDDAGGDKHDH
ncbi:hypothetical protein [Oleiharenicola sp. Vm1]|uniref:hypothetical protein n=1 Tax=Oleiharenicola sp. Vm1 TaxID=3398393 RepID=UPI0039F54E3B